MFEQVLESQRAFWSKQNVERPLLGCNIGPNASDRHPAVFRLLPEGVLKPDDLHVAPFLEDCERLYRSYQEMDVDYLFVVARFRIFRGWKR